MTPDYDPMETYAAVVLAAGKGSRMKSQTPKVLHRLCGKAMVSLVVEAAAQVNLDPIVVVVPQDSQAIKCVLGNRILYVEQSNPLGSGHALLQANSVLKHKENILVLSGDAPLINPSTLSDLMRLHKERGACITILTSSPADTKGLGRVVRSSSGVITAIVEEIEADETIRSISETNGGTYCFQAQWLWENLKSLPPSVSGEIFLTDLIGEAVKQGMILESISSRYTQETLGVNTRVQLAQAEAVMRHSIREHWMLNGITMPDPSSVFIDADTTLGPDTVVLPNTHITGRSRIGRNCEIGPNSLVSDSVVGDNCAIVASVVEESNLDRSVNVGPFSHLRPGTHLDPEVHIGNFTEIKNSRLGKGTKSAHFSYIGDADLGVNVNVGAGTVTCNYDGKKKNRTTVGDEASIGSDSMLVAPVNIGARATTGAGAVVTTDVPPDSLAVGIPARISPKKKSSKGKQQ